MNRPETFYIAHLIDAIHILEFIPARILEVEGVVTRAHGKMARTVQNLTAALRYQVCEGIYILRSIRPEAHQVGIRMMLRIFGDGEVSRAGQIPLGGEYLPLWRVECACEAQRRQDFLVEGQGQIKTGHGQIDMAERIAIHTSPPGSIFAGALLIRSLFYQSRIVRMGVNKNTHPLHALNSLRKGRCQEGIVVNQTFC